MQQVYSATWCREIAALKREEQKLVKVRAGGCLLRVPGLLADHAACSLCPLPDTCVHSKCDVGHQPIVTGCPSTLASLGHRRSRRQQSRATSRARESWRSSLCGCGGRSRQAGTAEGGAVGDTRLHLAMQGPFSQPPASATACLPVPTSSPTAGRPAAEDAHAPGAAQGRGPVGHGAHALVLCWNRLLQKRLQITGRLPCRPPIHQAPCLPACFLSPRVHQHPPGPPACSHLTQTAASTATVGASMATAGQAMAQMGVAADAKKMQQQVMQFRWAGAGRAGDRER